MNTRRQLLAALTAAPAASAPRPNFVFLLTGGHRSGMMGCAGEVRFPGEVESLAGGAGRRAAAEAAALMKRLGWEIDRLAATTGGD